MTALIHNSGDTERSRAVKERVKRFYAIPGNGCGGNLHLVLDDGNLEDGNIEFCRVQAERAGDQEGVDICNEMMRCTWEERCFVYGSAPAADDEECE